MLFAAVNSCIVFKNFLPDSDSLGFEGFHGGGECCREQIFDDHVYGLVPLVIFSLFLRQSHKSL